jgi:hypothetical protein
LRYERSVALMRAQAEARSGRQSKEDEAAAAAAVEEAERHVKPINADPPA